MTLPSRIQNSSPGGLRASTLPLGHWGFPQYWMITSERGRNIFVSLKIEGKDAVRARDLRLSKQAALTTAPESPDTNTALLREGITKPEKFFCQFPPWHPQPVVRDDPEITSRQVAITLIWYEHDPHPHLVDRLIFEIILIADRVADLHSDRYDHFIFCTTFYDVFF